MRYIAKTSFGIPSDDFPVIRFSSTKSGREENVGALPKDQFLKAAKLLYDEGDFHDSLLIHIMWSLASRPSEMITLRFEDFKEVDNSKQVHYFANKKNQRKTFTISDDLYEQVMEFRDYKMREGTYEVKTKTTPTRNEITGHFVFDVTRSTLQKKFSRKFKKLIPGFNPRAKDVRMSSLSNEMKDHGIHRATSLALHTSSRMTRTHYIRTAKDF
jgi:integrase